MTTLTVRKAAVGDIPAIHAFLEHYADLGIVLRRSREDILHYIANFFVAENATGVCACVAVRDFGNDLLEVRSLVVAPEQQGRGIGRELMTEVIAAVNAARASWRLFTLTKEPVFFGKLGFSVVERERFPEKIWSDCRNCPKHDCCDEVALILDSADYRARSH